MATWRWRLTVTTSCRWFRFPPLDVMGCHVPHAPYCGALRAAQRWSGVFLSWARTEAGHDQTSDGPKLRATQVILENKEFWLFKTAKGERKSEGPFWTEGDFQLSCKGWPCLGKCAVECAGRRGLIVSTAYSQWFRKILKTKQWGI